MADDLYAQCQTLYHARAAQLILYGRSLGLNRKEAEDVLQETFLAVLRLATPPAQLDRYFLVGFRNRTLNYRRGCLRRSLREPESRRWFETDVPDERQEEVLRRLAALPPAQREVIVLKIWQRQTFQAIGKLLGLSPNTVAGRYRYGLQKLRGSLAHEVYEDDETTQTRSRNFARGHR